jgi:hypothetical protein
MEVEMTAGRSHIVDIAAALRDPGRYFAEPKEILDAFGLDRETKIRLLDEWERDARSLAVAEEEGLADGEPSMLRRIRQARHALAGADMEPANGATKHG